MKRIGFVDYRLENFHANVYLKLLRGELKNRGYSVTGCWALERTSGREWARANEVPWCETPEELNERVDHFVVLAPGAPGKHLELCRAVFPFGKSTYVDKTFAPDLRTAREIFRLADRHGVAMHTTSALRYTEAQSVAAATPEGVRHMVAWGGGRSFGEYAIHPVEMVVSCLGPNVRELMRRGTGRMSQLLLNFSRERTAVVNVYTGAATPFAAALTGVEGTKLLSLDCGSIFRDTAEGFLELFDTGRPAVDRRESLAVVRILEAAGDPGALEGFVRV